MRQESKTPVNLAAILFSLLLAALMPLMFADLMSASFIKLHLSPQAALILILAMFSGGSINIPIHKVEGTGPAMEDPLEAFGLAGVWPVFRRVRSQTIIAVNVGGCIIPACLASYEVFRLVEVGSRAIVALLVAGTVNTVVCYLAAKPLPDVGIVMPAFLPACAAAMSAYILFPAQAPPIAFVAGVVGPIVGADLMHLNAFVQTTSGVMSIGGAGTFDGIILTSILAAYLA